MSLTSFITDRNFQELRDKFKAVFPRPTFPANCEPVAPPLSNNYAIIGCAFDYLVRFILQQRHSSKIKTCNHWVADLAVARIKKFAILGKTKNNLVGFRRDIPKNRKAFLEMLEKKHSDAKINYQTFLSTGFITDDLVRSALFLARLDVYVRSGMVDPNLGNEAEPDIADLKNLITLFEKNNFEIRKTCWLNPTFGEGSLLVGGADADIIIDDTLLEIKVTKELKLHRNHLNQLIGYYILSLIGGVDTDPNQKPIKNIGVYFARHGLLWKIPVLSLADKKTIIEFKDWFVVYANKNIWEPLDDLVQSAITKAAKKSAPLRKKKVAPLKKKKSKTRVQKNKKT